MNRLFISRIQFVNGLVGELFPERLCSKSYSVTLEGGRWEEHPIGSMQIIQNAQKA